MAPDPTTMQQGPDDVHGPSWLGHDIPYKALYWIIGILLIVALVTALLLWPAVRGLVHLSDRANASQRAVPVSADRPSGPLLQPKPENDMRAFRTLQTEITESYGWQDRGAGIARIPVERASEIVLEEGVGPLSGGLPTSSTGSGARR